MGREKPPNGKRTHFTAVRPSCASINTHLNTIDWARTNQSIMQKCLFVCVCVAMDARVVLHALWGASALSRGVIECEFNVSDQEMRAMPVYDMLLHTL